MIDRPPGPMTLPCDSGTGVPPLSVIATPFLSWYGPVALVARPAFTL
ncbi:hypothetical protein GCM10010358_01990 [Streptomyces minutiscleroticus]|uniref:Uncharacterized protein n=1 Tax=Streptomyces minutiscleroticus TaxID=68238 RepID=A0A918N9U5_9ACTN|nr:hypothetical protein GCM10010358_01990 [Streptomyces minutiscleroticus]